MQIYDRTQGLLHLLDALVTLSLFMGYLASETLSMHLAELSYLGMLAMHIAP